MKVSNALLIKAIIQIYRDVLSVNDLDKIPKVTHNLQNDVILDFLSLDLVSIDILKFKITVMIVTIILTMFRKCVYLL